MRRALNAFNFGPAIRKWITILYNDVESGVINGGYMTNYFKTSRGVRQGCPLSPFLFILSVELLVLKLRYIPECKGISLPNSQEVKLSQFADDTTLILSDIDSLKASLHHINSFGEILGLKLNVTKTKAMWIVSKKGCKNKIMNFAPIREPIKILGAYISYDQQKTNEANFFSRIQKMKTNLNIRTLLAKKIGVSQLIYTVSMLTVPENVIQKTQAKLFAFLWCESLESTFP